MAVRNDNEAYRHISYSQIYPKFKATEALRRNGFKDDFHGIVPTVLIPALLSDSRAKTLIKAGKAEHLKCFLDNSRAFDACWQSYKIAVRNGYDIEDISIWCDYVDMLCRLGKDIHSPKYVCPTDLHREHDLRQNELRRQREKGRKGEETQKGNGG